MIDVRFFMPIARLAAFGAFLAFAMNPSVRAETTADQLEILRTIQAGDEAGQRTAAAATRALAQAKDIELVEVLDAMLGATPIGKNWLLGLANELHDASDTSTNKNLESFLADTAKDPEARYTVFRWLTDADPKRRTQMLETMLTDPSMEIRYDAIAQALNGSEVLEPDRLRELLDAARHPEHIATIIDRLDKAGVSVDQAQHMGFVIRWNLIGPFDNIGSDKFDVAYPVEVDWLQGTLATKYAGKNGEVTWFEGSTDKKDGQMDLATFFNKEKGCIVYAETQIDVPSDLDCEVRVGCINAQKVWVNGELLIANEVYHTGMQIDQYAAPVRLKAGKNRVLVKVCQNEQTQAWAQDYSFQLRFCDATGKAITTK